MGMRYRPDDPMAQNALLRDALLMQQGQPNVPRDPIKEMREKKLMEAFLKNGGGPAYGIKQADRIPASQNPFAEKVPTPDEMAMTQAAVRFAGLPPEAPKTQPAVNFKTYPDQFETPLSDQNQPVPTIHRENDAEQLVDRPSDLPGTSDNPKPPEPGDHQTWPGQGALRDALMQKAMGPKETSQAATYSPEYIEAIKNASGTNRNLGFMALLARSANQMGAIGGRVADSSGVEAYTKQLQGDTDQSMQPVADAENLRVKQLMTTGDPRTKLMLELLKAGSTDLKSQAQIAMTKANFESQAENRKTMADIAQQNADTRSAPPLRPMHSIERDAIQAEIDLKKANASKAAKEAKAPGAGRPVTAGAAKVDYFRKRMESANRAYDKLLADNPNYDPTNVKDRAASGLGPMGNSFKSEIGKLAEQYEVEFIRANLRDESGAVISRDEAVEQAAAYFPRLGDSKAKIAEKARARQVMIDAMKDSYAVQTGQEPAAMETRTPGAAPTSPAEAAPPGMKWQRNRVTGERRLVPL